MTYDRSTAQHGSAFFVILIAIAMFAMLSYAVSKGGRVSQTSLTTEQAKLIAEEVISYGQGVGTAVGQLRLRGYTDTQISFQGALSAASYTNPNCTEDGCKVFSIGGGKMISQKPPAGANDGSDYYFSGKLRVDGVGTGKGGAAVVSHIDLLIILPNVKLEVCKEINKLVGTDRLATNPPKDTIDSTYLGTPFQGVYGPGPQTIGQSGFQGFPSACYEGGGNPAAGTYHYYNVLVAR